MEPSGGMQQSGAAGSMASAEQAYLRAELERRHHRLETALKSPSAEPGLTQLLGEVDAALSRMDKGSFGLCEICHDPIERDRLLADPLVRFCLDDLSGEERQALEHDLALAAKIQRRLLPPQNGFTTNWEISYYYQPARLVSGDYCDYFSSDRDFLFLCGDVSGKGVAASMLRVICTRRFAVWPIVIFPSAESSKQPIGFFWKARLPVSSRHLSLDALRKTEVWNW